MAAPCANVIVDGKGDVHGLFYHGRSIKSDIAAPRAVELISDRFRRIFNLRCTVFSDAPFSRLKEDRL